MKKNTSIIVSISVVAVIILVVIIFKGGDDEKDNNKSTANVSDSTSGDDGYIGDRGEEVRAVGDIVQIALAEVEDGNMHSYNYFSKKEDKTIYFFVVKALDGTYRVAANACEVCHETKKGFSQVGDMIKCNNCGNQYSKDSIAKDRGGCNPRPIDADAPVNGDQLEVAISDLESSSDLF